ncbi:GerMN domain-containing protein [Arthrobacter bambusae]|uniref:GerMN domain-containing protein n=1 Tax=Arthrobacter TaxID=1663 RepID=UPI001F51429A|nr:MULTISPECIES: GerMN domain-containing protein [Arthrobacter]MCI0142785.1 GerMN domain-containing protein [Arthrobacter bambusae]UYY81360.1 GerMN domain-containing protein [Arthrobacter sp. YA7-1]
MGVRRGAKGTTTAIAALCLSLALCLAGCASPDGGTTVGSGSAQPASPGFVHGTQKPVIGPVPAPLPAPPPYFNPPPAASLPTKASPQEPATGPVPAPLPSVGESTGTTVFFVAIGDGGNHGARFGCDDSLVAIQVTSPSGSDPLAVAMGQLLAPDDTASRAGLYNALSGSALHYVSGYLDGTTAVVNLSGSLRPEGLCEQTRIETQLAQTAVEATGASQAAIYIDGNTLADVLSLRPGGQSLE